jgi:hypothetical protein
MEKLQALDSLITEHDGFKHDIELIKEFVEQRKREAQAREQHSEDFSTDGDNARSVATIIPHELGGWMRRMRRPLPNMRIPPGPAARSVDREPPNHLWVSLMTTITTGRNQDHTFPRISSTASNPFPAN